MALTGYTFLFKYKLNLSSLGTPVSVDSLTSAASVATVTISAGHGYIDGQSILMAGANQAEYNGVFEITYISTTQFSYTITGSPVSPATGTITALRTVTNFKVPFSDKNLSGPEVDLLMAQCRPDGLDCRITDPSGSTALPYQLVG